MVELQSDGTESEVIRERGFMSSLGINLKSFRAAARHCKCFVHVSNKPSLLFCILQK